MIADRPEWRSCRDINLRPVRRPVVTVDPAVRFGQPAVRGVSTDALAGRVWAGDGVNEVADDYGFTRADVLVACWFEGIYGSPRFRRRWRRWAEAVHDQLWRPSTCDYDAIPDPPTREDTTGG